MREYTPWRRPVSYTHLDVYKRQALGWYQKLASKAGAGTLVPITGFANAVVSPAIEFRSEGLVTGVGAKMFIIAGPVIVYGMLASVAWGIIYWAVRPLLGG